MQKLISRAIAVSAMAAVMSVGNIVPAASAPPQTSKFTSAQIQVLAGIAADTWNFYSGDVDPNTHLPLDNLGPGAARGTYASPSDIGAYLWAVVAAYDLGLVNRRAATTRISATLTELGTLASDHGFLHQWYDTTTAQAIKGPFQPACATQSAPAYDSCSFISNVDNGWYASALIIVRSAFPRLKAQVDALLQPMDFGLFYDNRPQTNCNVDASGQPTGQMFGGYYAGLPFNAGFTFHDGVFYSDPRISAYIGMGLHQMPGDVWWRSWRVLPPKQCTTDPDFSWQGQWPLAGSWKTYADPQSGKTFNVFEGHYSYLGGSPLFIPTFSGGMFEALMPDLIVPETSWGPTSFGLADQRSVQVQETYATNALHYPVWGISPSSTPDDTGGYNGYGVEGLAFPYYGNAATTTTPSEGLSTCHGCADESVVTPHAAFLALDAMPQDAYTDIQSLRTLYPDIYRSSGGFYDAVNPTTGSVGHRDLVLDQSMIMAALDNAINNGALQQHFAADPVSAIAKLYLSSETFTI